MKGEAMQFKGWELKVEMEAVQAPSSIKLIGSGGEVINSIPEPTQTIHLHLTAPDGRNRIFSVTLYTLCHGENPKIILGEPSIWAQGEPDADKAVGIWFPDGTLNVFPNFETLWED